MFEESTMRVTPKAEKALLQSTVGLASLVPILAGLFGVLAGAHMFGGGTDGMDSHFRYLSGLLLGIGLAFVSTIPRIEFHRRRFRLLTAIVVTGGIGRLLGVLLTGALDTTVLFALVMELVVTPTLCVWQNRAARREF
jgi:uncharacterized membrane protein YfcA